MRIAAFTPGNNIPSARFRVRQFIEPLAAEGIDLCEFTSATTAYPPPGKLARLAWAAKRVPMLAATALRSRSFDGVLLQREMISGFATLESWTGMPRIFDVDDSIHLLRGGRAARKLAQMCDRVIAGNSWLAEWYGQWNRDVVVLPTAVDTKVYRPAEPREQRAEIVVGWIGTSSNFVHLAEIEEALGQALEHIPQLSLKIVSDRPPPLPLLDPTRWRFERWSEAREVADIQSMDIGIMPLSADRWGDWARGKCSFKMLQYMSCGLPVVVSPIGMNADVLDEAEVGIGAAGTRAWRNALCDLGRSRDQRASMGLAGRQVVERRYSTGVISGGLAKALRSVVER